MASLIHNQVIQIDQGPWEGTYRVVLAMPLAGKTALAKLTNTSSTAQLRGRKRMVTTKHPRKKAPLPLVGELIWIDDVEFRLLEDRIRVVELEHEQFILSTADQKLYESRKVIMAEFLDYDKLYQAIHHHGRVTELISATVSRCGVSKPLVYKLWSQLCRVGFSAESLKPRRNRCGARGIPRSCDPGGCNKSGRKTNAERVARITGQSQNPSQPGMSSEWRRLIMLADKRISSPKPTFPNRYEQIVNSHFVKRFRIENGSAIPLELKKGEYPNRGQVRRVLETEIPRLTRLLEKTTKGHFARSLRGMSARNWKGVAGPGHTWAIDSTIGDIYLRSSINRAWIIGRPIVYIIVDVWSTAIVGFYVCLSGPSWDTAKVSLFSAAADPQLLGELWQYHPLLSLNPAPTLPVFLQCDRGEYLSRAASQTSFRLIPGMSYTPPYRPDLKGLVEVLHRIEKDKQYLWVPGSIDARRAEYELRRFDPNESVLTTPEYADYLQTTFTTYNLTADRTKRVDTHMIAAGVIPSPAGLWRWGHDVGIGTLRAFPRSELISTLLPKQKARVTRSGVRFSGLHYESEVVTSEKWTERARNFGGWEIDAHHFPGSVSQIWTPNLGSSGLLDLKLSQQTQASPEQTFDEVLDAFMYRTLSASDLEHARVLHQINSVQRVEAIILRAKLLTDEAMARHNGATPSMSESRKMEINPEASDADTSMAAPRVATEPDEAEAAYLEMMAETFAAANAFGDTQ